ncbi:DNA-binding response regulator [Ktedonobacteria bacterium brp13]|nr:DNA-binding response regulator [Ktedonobacteria bacterium brp13]
MKTILITKIEADIHYVLSNTLSAHDYTIVELPSNHSVLEEILRLEPDLLVLDSHELDLCSSIRQRRLTLPIIFLGSATNARLIVQALDRGADDYVIYPWAIGELAARIRAKLRLGRRSTQIMEEPHCFTSRDGYLSLNVFRHEVLVDGHLVQLTRTAFAILQILMTNAEKVLTHRMLLQQVWGDEYGEEIEYVRVYIRHIRLKVEEDPSHPCYILTEPGVGYVFRSSPRKKLNK